MPVGFLLPADSSMPIIEVGRSCKLEQLKVTSIIIGNVTVDFVGLFFCIDSMAFMPSGVAAPFIPRRFAEIFIETYFLLSLERLFLPKILFIIGDRSLDNLPESPLCSKIENNPIQIAYIARSSSESLTALFDAVKSPERTFVGSKKQSDITLIANKKIQILFIIKDMIMDFVL